MSRRWSEQVWRKDADSEELRHARDAVVDAGFWHYVDSQAAPGVWSREGDWVNVRGDGCMAASSARAQCTMDAIEGLPFCEGHFDYAWVAICAFVTDDRFRHVRERADDDLALALTMNRLSLEQVRDARRTLARKPERVYFFVAGHAVKIGRSIHPERRVKTLTGTKAPADVDVATGTLLGTIPGGCHVESELHRQFAAHRLDGEWFELAPIRTRLEGLLREHEERAA